MKDILKETVEDKFIIMDSNKRIKLNLEYISKYRDELFGISMIAIILFHFTENYAGAIDNGIIEMSPLTIKSILILVYYKLIGSIGVEIFVFLSGMGLYYSYAKNSNIQQFYKRRYKRILVPYFVVATVFWAIKDLILKNEGIRGFLADISFYSFVKEGVKSIWFIALLIVLYFLFPAFYYLLYKCKNKRIWLVVLLIVSYGVPILIYHGAPNLYGRIEIAMTRVPLFIMGCYAGKYIQSGYRLPVTKALNFFAIALVLKGLSIYCDFEPYFDRYISGVYALGLILAVTGAVYIYNDYLKIRKILRFFGKYSLELYMVHVTMRNLMGIFGFNTYRISQYFSMILLAIIASVLLSKFCGIFNKPKLC